MKYGYLGALLFFVTILPLGSAYAAQTNVSMVGMTFSPSTITIAAGDTVAWTNNSTLQHTVTADDGSFDSGTINMGSTYSHTFVTPGAYRYYCRFHGAPGGVGMSGTIVVMGSSPQPNPNPNPMPNPNPRPYPSPMRYQQLYWCGTHYAYAPCRSMNTNYGNYNYNSNYNYSTGYAYNPFYSYRPYYSYYYNPYQYQFSYQYPTSYYSYSYAYPTYSQRGNGYYSYW